MIAKAADGSMRDALTLLDQAYSFSDDITDKELQSLLGLPEWEIITNLSETILKGDISATLSIIKELTDRGSDLRQLTKELVKHFRNIAVEKITRDAGGLLEFSDEEVQRLRDLSSDVSMEQLTLLLSELLKIDSEVRSAINPRYTLELGLLRTSFVKGMTSVESILKMLNESPENHEITEEKTGTGKKPSAPEKKTEVKRIPDTENKTDIRNKEGIWQRLLEKVDSKDHLLACKLSEARLLNLTTSELSIGFNGGMSVLADSIKSKSSIIQPILRRLSGHNLKLNILSLPGEKAKKDNKKIKEEVFAEPLVKDALRIFDGSLLRVKSLEDKKGIKE